MKKLLRQSYEETGDLKYHWKTIDRNVNEQIRAVHKPINKRLRFRRVHPSEYAITCNYIQKLLRESYEETGHSKYLLDSINKEVMKQVDAAMPRKV